MTATNTGAVTVTITSARLAIRGKGETIAPMGWVAQSPSPLPIVLAPGQHWNGLVNLTEIQASLARQYGGQPRMRVRPVVSDAADREFAAKS